MNISGMIRDAKQKFRAVQNNKQAVALKNNEDDLKKLKEERIRVEATASMLKQRNAELDRISKAKTYSRGNSKLGRFGKGLAKVMNQAKDSLPGKGIDFGGQSKSNSPFSPQSSSPFNSGFSLNNTKPKQTKQKSRRIIINL